MSVGSWLSDIVAPTSPLSPRTLLRLPSPRLPAIPNLQNWFQTWLDTDLLIMVIKAGQRRRWLGLCFGLGLLFAWNWILVSAAIAGRG